MHLLLTGATGFIGRHLCEELTLHGHTVRAMGRRSRSGPWERFLLGDLEGDLPAASELRGIDAVIHLAGKAHALSERPGERESYFRSITEGTRRLVELSLEAGIPRFLYISSVKAGELPSGPAPEGGWPEEAMLPPATPYGEAKLAAERIVREAGFARAVVLRPCLVYGPGNRGNLAAMVEAIRRGRFPPIPDTGNRRSLVHVHDVVQACRLAVIDRDPDSDSDSDVEGGGVYQITDGVGYSTREMYDRIRAALGMPHQGWAIPYGLLKAAALCGDFGGAVLRRRLPLDSAALGKLCGSAHYSCAAARERLGYRPTVTFREGVRDLISG